jgi:putative addiction module component (TIGR02574 family)
VEAIYNTISQNSEISDEHKIILDKRLKDHQENPTSGRNWNEIKAELSLKYSV